MLPLNIDISSFVEEAVMTDQEVRNFSGMLLDSLALKFQSEWMNQVNTGLHSTRQEYMRGMFIERPDDNTVIFGVTARQSRLAVDLEVGKGAFDEKCIINPNTLIYTSTGYVKIKDIQVNSLVLTHSGKFQRVVSLFKERNSDDYIYRILVGPKSYSVELLVTKNHPVLTDKGWIRAENLDLNIHKVCIRTQKCSNPDCSKLIPIFVFDDTVKLYCSKSCAAKVNNGFRREFGRIDMTPETWKRVGETTVKTTQRLLLEGKHVSQTGKLREWGEKNGFGFENLSDQELQRVQHLAAIGLGKKHNFSDPESKLFEKIKNIDGLERQYPFRRKKTLPYNRKRLGTLRYLLRLFTDFCKLTQPRYRRYFFDFAIPKYKICIEVNGEQHHTIEQVQLKRLEIESRGWRYLGFWSKEIYSSIDICVEEINRVLMNHNNEYTFDFIDFKIEKIRRVSHATRYNYKYNLTVEDDSSYIANGIVTHNSGFESSTKKTMKKDGGWYLTVPFRHSTPGSVGESSAFTDVMPESVYKIAKSQNKAVTLKQLPTSLQVRGVRPTLQMNDRTVPAYRHKAAKFEGLIRMVDERENRGQYMTFRRVSDKSDQNSWIHKGFEAHNFLGKTLEKIDISGTIRKVRIDFLNNR